jgi:hypothetical protein
MSAGMADAPFESARYWISQVELSDTVAFIHRHGFKRVALQVSQPFHVPKRRVLKLLSSHKLCKSCVGT